MQRRRFLTSAGVAATASFTAFSGCLGVSGNDDPGYDIGMTAQAFVEDEFTVSPGETVSWYNNSSRSHTVTAYEASLPEGATFFASGGFDDEQTARDEWWANRGGAMENGDEFTVTFEEPGQYDYFCIPHEQGAMIGSIYVEE